MHRLQFSIVGNLATDNESQIHMPNFQNLENVFETYVKRKLLKFC